MKILVTSDLHQWIPKWKDLVKIVGKEKPRFALIAGDLLPKTGGYSAQKRFFSELKTYCQQMKRSASVTVLTYFGNDDFHILEPLLDELEAGGLCLNLNGRVHREEGLVFCGMNRVRDYLSAVSQSVPPRVEMKGFKMYHPPGGQRAAH